VARVAWVAGGDCEITQLDDMMSSPSAGSEGGGHALEILQVPSDEEDGDGGDAENSTQPANDHEGATHTARRVLQHTPRKFSRPALSTRQVDVVTGDLDPPRLPNTPHKLQECRATRFATPAGGQLSPPAENIGGRIPKMGAVTAKVDVAGSSAALSAMVFANPISPRTRADLSAELVEDDGGGASRGSNGELMFEEQKTRIAVLEQQLTDERRTRRLAAAIAAASGPLPDVENLGELKITDGERISSDESELSQGVKKLLADRNKKIQSLELQLEEKMQYITEECAMSEYQCVSRAVIRTAVDLVSPQMGVVEPGDRILPLEIRLNGRYQVRLCIASGEHKNTTGWVSLEAGNGQRLFKKVPLDAIRDAAKRELEMQIKSEFLDKDRRIEQLIEERVQNEQKIAEQTTQIQGLQHLVSDRNVSFATQHEEAMTTAEAAFQTKIEQLQTHHTEAIAAATLTQTSLQEEATMATEQNRELMEEVTQKTLELAEQQIRTAELMNLERRGGMPSTPDSNLPEAKRGDSLSSVGEAGQCVGAESSLPIALRHASSGSTPIPTTVATPLAHMYGATTTAHKERLEAEHDELKAKVIDLEATLTISLESERERNVQLSEQAARVEQDMVAATAVRRRLEEEVATTDDQCRELLEEMTLKILELAEQQIRTADLGNLLAEANDRNTAHDHRHMQNEVLLAEAQSLRQTADKAVRQIKLERQMQDDTVDDLRTRLSSREVHIENLRRELEADRSVCCDLELQLEKRNTSDFAQHNVVKGMRAQIEEKEKSIAALRLEAESERTTRKLAEQRAQKQLAIVEAKSENLSHMLVPLLEQVRVTQDHMVAAQNSPDATREAAGVLLKMLGAAFRPETQPIPESQLDPQPEPEPEPVSMCYRVVKRIRLRADPCRNSAVTEIMLPGEEFQVLERQTNSDCGMVRCSRGWTTLSNRDGVASLEPINCVSESTPALSSPPPPPLKREASTMPPPVRRQVPPPIGSLVRADLQSNVAAETLDSDLAEIHESTAHIDNIHEAFRSKVQSQSEHIKQLEKALGEKEDMVTGANADLGAATSQVAALQLEKEERQMCMSDLLREVESWHTFVGTTMAVVTKRPALLAAGAGDVANVVLDITSEQRVILGSVSDLNTFSVTLSQPGPLGIKFRRENVGVFVAYVKPGSQAAESQKLYPGLQLVALQADGVEHLVRGYNEVLRLLRSASRPLRLSFAAKDKSAWPNLCRGDIASTSVDSSQRMAPPLMDMQSTSDASRAAELNAELQESRNLAKTQQKFIASQEQELLFCTQKFTDRVAAVQTDIQRMMVANRAKDVSIIQDLTVQLQENKGLVDKQQKIIATQIQQLHQNDAGGTRRVADNEATNDLASRILKLSTELQQSQQLARNQKQKISAHEQQNKLLHTAAENATLSEASAKADIEQYVAAFKLKDEQMKQDASRIAMLTAELQENRAVAAKQQGVVEAQEQRLQLSADSDTILKWQIEAANMNADIEQLMILTREKDAKVDRLTSTIAQLSLQLHDNRTRTQSEADTIRELTAELQESRELAKKQQDIIATQSSMPRRDLEGDSELRAEVRTLRGVVEGARENQRRSAEQLSERDRAISDMERVLQKSRRLFVDVDFLQRAMELAKTTSDELGPPPLPPDVSVSTSGAVKLLWGCPRACLRRPGFALWICSALNLF
jgi:hypothetical protein